MGLPRFNFQLRVSPPEKIASAIRSFDDVMYDAIRSLFGSCSLLPEDMDRISFPISKSGFGIGLAQHTAQPAYVGSVFHSAQLQSKLLSSVTSEEALVNHYAPLLSNVNASLPVDKQISTPVLLASSEPQHLLSSAMVASRVSAFVASCGTPRELRVVEAGLKCSNGNWLEAPYGFDSMDSLSWRCAARFRLGKPIFSQSVPCPSCRREPLDIYGIHATYCNGDGDCIHRHNAVRDLLIQMCRSAKLPVSDHEPGFLLSDTVSGDKPADVFIRNWKLGRGLCLDVCIANSLENCNENPSDVLGPLKRKVALKNEKYETRCTERGFMFKPFVCGSLGGFSDDAVKVMKDIGKSSSAVLGVTKGVAVDHIRKRVAFAIQKAQATAWIRRGHMADVLLS